MHQDLESESRFRAAKKALVQDRSAPEPNDFTRLILRVDLENALATLTGPQRDVVILRYLEDLDLEEVAERLGRTRNATDALHHRALVKLRMLLVTRSFKSRG